MFCCCSDCMATGTALQHPVSGKDMHVRLHVWHTCMAVHAAATTASAMLPSIACCAVVAITAAF